MWNNRIFGLALYGCRRLYIIGLVVIQGCATTVAVVDVAASTTIYAGKTVVNTIDAITPDIINRDGDSDKED